MTTFVNEQIKRLDKTLTQSFEKSLQGKSSIKNFSALSEKDQFLVQATQKLDLTADNLPTFDQVQQFLEKYNTQYVATKFDDTDTADSSLEWLFVAKCAIVIYGQVFSNILNQTLPISESIDYWNSINGSTFNEIYYALQVAPKRIYDLLKNALHQVSSISSLTNDMISLFTSSDYVLSHLFPVHNEKLLSDPSIQSFRGLGFFNMSSFRRHPLVFQMIRDEIALKKQTLQHTRSQQAASLGVLLLTPPEFEYQSAETGITAVMSKETKQCIEMIKYVLEPSDKNEKNTHHFHGQLSSMNMNPSVQEVSAELSQLITNWSTTYQKRLQSTQSLYGVPSTLTRYWIPALVSYFCGSFLIRYGFHKKEDIIHYTEEFGKTAHDFILNWVWEPMVKVYNTIRLKDQRLGLLSKEGLQSDLDSLERMVVGFARNNLHLSEDELSRIAFDVREGDISVLLREYEKEIKSPLKNVIIGDLLQTILIQVQKTKVDVDLAMSALDKLLKSNELNFAFLAVAPSMLLTYASSSWLRNILQGRSKQKLQKKGIPIRETLRRVERQLILNKPIGKGELSEWTVSENQHQAECETQGIILCEVHVLRAYALSLPLQSSTRARFLEDIRDLENPTLTNEQKIQTIARMNRFWKFL